MALCYVSLTVRIVQFRFWPWCPRPYRSHPYERTTRRLRVRISMFTTPSTILTVSPPIVHLSSANPWSQSPSVSLCTLTSSIARMVRDLSTTKQKLDVDKYDPIDAFEADLDLLIDNAVRYNASRGWKDILSRSREIQGHAFLASYHIQYKEERRR